MSSTFMNKLYGIFNREDEEFEDDDTVDLNDYYEDEEEEEVVEGNRARKGIGLSNGNHQKRNGKGCKKLVKVTIKSTKIKQFGKGLFKGTSKKLVVKVPKKSKKSYKSKLKKAGFKGKVK